ncbi:MAG TPA: class I SAM-dependent methyltransferase [Chloroflexota bacterium]|nr:class I SAM-dependent methyltransferase [Chloroflexota bacterium]
MKERPSRPSSRPGRRPRVAAGTSWDALAHWYDGWVGEGGSEHHRRLAIPTVLTLLDPHPGERILDVGAGQGVLVPFLARAGAVIVGIDASPRLLEMARRRHGRQATFLLGDATKLPAIEGLTASSFDAAVFLLSIQDMDPLDDVLAGTAWALRPGGQVVILLTHPSFRIPRQSGWGWDENRKLTYRRIDRYLTPLPVPLRPLAGEPPTRSFHRPLQSYVNGLSDHGLYLDRMVEVPAEQLTTGTSSKKADALARREIPLFLGLRAFKAKEGCGPAESTR